MNHLMQLQELNLIRDEQKAGPNKTHLESLNDAIEQMADKLPDEVHTMFEKLRQRNPVAVVPVSNSTCSVCGMRLPTSLVQEVQIGREIHNCPNCARILFVPASAARRIGATTRRMGPRKVGITRFSSKSLMLPRLESRDAEGAIRELAEQMQSEGFVDNVEPLVEGALRREAILSTAVDHGLAFPHVRGVEGGGLTLTLGINPKGVRFEDQGRGLTRIVFFIVIPTAASAFYLKLLAGLTETFRKEEARESLMAEEDPDKLWKTLCKVTRSTIK